MEKFKLQEEQYKFPYHYVSYLENGIAYNKRVLSWGFEYLTYIDYVVSLIKQIKNAKNLLDVGCGDGYLINNCSVICPQIEMQGIDLVENAIKFANAFARNKNVKFQVKDIKDVKEKFDIVTLIEVLEHIPDEEIDVFLRNVISKIKKDGYFIISVPTDVRPVAKKHYRHYNEQLLNKQIDYNFKNLVLVSEKRIYRKKNLIARLIHRFLDNKFFSINYKPILRLFWKYHVKYNYFADLNDGTHIVRMYKKIRD